MSDPLAVCTNEDSGELSTFEESHYTAVMKYNVSPGEKVSVNLKAGNVLPKFEEGMKKLSMSDPLVICTIEDSGIRYTRFRSFLSEYQPNCALCTAGAFEDMHGGGLQNQAVRAG